MKTLLFIVILLPLACLGQKSYSFEQIDSLQQIEKRPLAIYLHTDWCKYCLMMEETTFKDKVTVALLDSAFYFIRFNAESKEEIRFNNATFKNRDGKNHDLAIALSDKDKGLVFPTLVFMTPLNEIMHQQNGFTDASSLIRVFNILLNEN